MAGSNYHTVKDGNLFFDFKGNRIIMSAEASNWRDSKSEKTPVYRFVAAVMKNLLAGDTHGMREEFLSIDFDIAKLLKDDLERSSMDGNYKGKIQMSEEYKLKFTRIADEFRKMVATLDAIEYHDVPTPPRED
jgi:hypothetical protein